MTIALPANGWPARLRERARWRIARFRARLRILIATTKQAPRKARILVIVVGVYLVSPLDIVPNFIPGLGVLDDIVVLGSACWLLNRWDPATARALRNLVR